MSLAESTTITPSQSGFRPPYDQWCADIRLHGRLGHWYYLNTNDGPRPMARTIGLRADRTGNYGPGKEAVAWKRYSELQDCFLAAAWEGKVAFGPRLPACKDQAGWDDRHTSYFCLDFDAHDRRLPRRTTEDLCRSLLELLEGLDLPPRYCTISSTDDNDECGGVHLIWVCEEPVLLPEAAALAYRVACSLAPAAVRSGIQVIEVAPWKRKPMLLIDGLRIKALGGYIRWPCTMHPKHARGSEVISFGPRSTKSEIAAVLERLSAETLAERESENLEQRKTTTFEQSSPVPAKLGCQTCAQWQAKHQAYWAGRKFLQGTSATVIPLMAGAIAYYYNASESEVRHVTTRIVDAAVAEQRYHCRRPPEQFVEELVSCWRKFQDDPAKARAYRREVTFHQGEFEYLAGIVYRSEQILAYFAMTLSKIAERNRKSHFFLPAVNAMRYVSLNCPGEPFGIDQFRYLVLRCFNPQSASYGGGLALEERIPSREGKAVQYCRGMEELKLGETFTQSDVEAKLSLVPLTPKLLRELGSSHLTDSRISARSKRRVNAKSDAATT